MPPTKVYSVERRCIAITQTHYKRATNKHISIFAIQAPADLWEAVGRDQFVSETLPFFLVASNALGKLQAHVLKLDQIRIDRSEPFEADATAIADFSEIHPMF